jgi:DNA-binding XRE family transcriptional regulator
MEVGDMDMEVGDMAAVRSEEYKSHAIDVGERLKRIRIKKGFTQLAMAKKIGINTDLYSKYERGIYLLPLLTFIRIVIALETTAKQVLGV